MPLSEDDVSCDSDADSVLCDPESFDAHYLEKDPQIGHQDGEDDPDDPDSSGDEKNVDEESSDESDGELADYASEELNAEAALVNNLTKGQLILLQLATASRTNKTFECLLDYFKNLNMLLGTQ